MKKDYEYVRLQTNLKLSHDYENNLTILIITIAESHSEIEIEHKTPS